MEPILKKLMFILAIIYIISLGGYLITKDNPAIETQNESSNYTFLTLPPVKEGEIVGRFIILSDEGEINANYYTYHQYLVYDKDTYIIYIYELGSYHTAISPYYCLDENDNPQIAVYREGLGRSKYEN